MRRGKFELADGGTIFLDEVGDLHEASQAAAAHPAGRRAGAVEASSPFAAARVISATNRRLDELIAAGRFREDLYYRLSVVPIRVPALRERPQDVGELAPYCLDECCARNNFRKREIDPDVVRILERYSWPGNVRELRNVVERMAILTVGDRITAESIPIEIRLPQSPRSTAGLQEIRDSAERQRIRGTRPDRLERVWRRPLLGTERTSLHKRIRTLGLKRE
jgi:two-component system nitrogen regulation response regulator NtrX